MLTRGIIEGPYDLASVVDPGGTGVNRAGDINCGEGRTVFEKAMSAPHGISEAPNDLAGVVDPVWSKYSTCMTMHDL